MGDFAKLAAVGLLGMILAVTVRRQSPELAILTSLAAGLLILTAAMRYIGTIMDFWADIVRSTGLGTGFADAVLKTVAIAVMTQLGAQLCRDGGEGALAAKLELAGSAACIVVTLPLLAEVLSTVTAML